MLLNGSEILLECLLEQKVDTVFGYPGGAVLNIYDALYKYRDKINHYLTSHEQGASHAADGYARVTGNVGVCIATSGPGATNLVTGIATANMDSVPIICITGNVSNSLLGKDSFQEVDITGIVMPIVKHSFMIKDVSKLAETVRKAFHIARSGRPGPVLIDITKDVSADIWEYERKDILSNEPKIEKIKDNDLNQAKELIISANKPFIYAGGGIISSNATKELLDFVDKIDAPITNSLMGKGAIPSEHKKYTGLIGMHGTKASNLGIQNCDLLITLGARFSDRVIGDVAKFAKNAKVLQIDIDPSEIDKNVITNHSLVGDLKILLTQLLNILPTKKHKEWNEYISKLKIDYPLQNYDTDGLKPWHILNAINELTNNDCIVSTEVGQHQMFAAQYIKTQEPRHFITSAGLGTMGYGLGASIGAKVAMPHKIVFNIAGDGCFRMNNIELATMVEYDIPVIVCVFNNHALGMVRQWQTLFYDKRYSNTDLSTKTTDFVALAKAYGCNAYNVFRIDEVKPTLKKAIESNKPCVINFELNNNDQVLPMVRLGSGIDDLILE